MRVTDSLRSLSMIRPVNGLELLSIKKSRPWSSTGSKDEEREEVMQREERAEVVEP
jgi:hypothetical protein